MGLRNFLKGHVAQSLHALRHHQLSAINTKVYLGNEAADADSIVSSLCCSYFDFLQHSVLPVESTVSKAFIPFVSINRCELRLRRDVEVLLGKVNVLLEDLVCLDDIPSFVGLNPDSVHVTLLDHNHLSSKEVSFIKRLCKIDASLPLVTEIIDHHADFGQHVECCGMFRNIAYNNEQNVAEAGSACTLLAEKFLSQAKRLDSDIATLLLGVIALDTINMSPQAGKGTPRDATAIAELAKVTSHSTQGLYDELSNAKLDRGYWNGLSAADCLLLDYKLFHVAASSDSGLKFDIGMAAVLLPIEDFLSKADLVGASAVYLQTCDILVVMTLYDVRDVIHRDLLFISKSEDRLHSIEQFLNDTERTKLDLKLQAMDLKDTNYDAADSLASNGLHYRVYRQGNIKASRKQLSPLLNKYYELYLD